MTDGYSWSELRDGGTCRLPGPQHLGWWAAVAMLVSILLHIVVFFVLDRMKIALRFEQARELSTGPINVRQVEVRPMELAKPAPPENVVTPPVDAASLLEEIDLLAALPKDTPIDIKPDIKDAEYALQVKNPAIKGDPAAIAMKVSANLEVDTDLPEFGRTPEQLKPAEVGQVTVDPGAAQMDDKELGKYTDALIKRGANGNVEKGALDGIASLDALLDLPPNILLGKKTMLPSDLLFEFNSADLRESAKVGLMKLALLMDRNPNLYCWIEGHTDLVGGDEFNLDLSMRRAGSVKTYLTQSMRMDAARISTRGFGRYEPLVIRGTAEEQALNRRVEIRMRKTPPPKDQLKITPKKAAVIEHAPPPKTETTPPPPKGLPIKPKSPPPVAEDPVPPRAEPAPPRAAPVIDFPPLPDVPKATPVEPAPPIATPRAEPVRE
jgi:outer membrane protein OmpA-like peptidoglycan-associated protein